jgi:hypothetical protein
VPAPALAVRPSLPRPAPGRPYPAGRVGHTQRLLPNDLPNDLPDDLPDALLDDLPDDLADGEIFPPGIGRRPGDADAGALDAAVQDLAGWMRRRRRRGAAALAGVLTIAAALAAWAWQVANGGFPS